jgi:hypothetical protein
VISVRLCSLHRQGVLGRCYVSHRSGRGGLVRWSNLVMSFIAAPFCPVVSCAAMSNGENITASQPKELAAGKPPKSPIPSDLLKWLGGHRDGFLVVGAILYGLGYLVRWLFARQYSQGDLPALDFQYIMSGIIPALVLAFTWAAIALFPRWRKRVAGTFSGLSTWVRLPLTLVPLGGALYLLHHFGIEGLGFSGFLLVQLIFLIVSYFLMLTFDEPDAWLQNTIVLMVLVFSFVLYFWLYPSVPRVLGGPKPSHAYVDLVRDEVGADTLAELTLVGKANDVGSEKVVRSKLLDVYFANGDTLWVRAHINSSVNPGPLYELRKETIRAIQWCGDGS